MPLLKGSNRFKAVAGLMVKAAAEAVFPSKCLGCGAFYHPDDKEKGGAAENAGAFNPENGCGKEMLFAGLMSPFFCRSCALNFTSIDPPMCEKCGAMFPSRTAESHVCGSCLKTPGKYDRARAAGAYRTTLMAAIHNLKYRGKTRLAEPLGRLLFSVYQSHWKPGAVDFAIPVPLHVKKLKSRGFNQSALLVRNWPKLNGSGNGRVGPVVEHGIFVRVKETPSQTGLEKRQRLNNVKDAFFVTKPEKVRGKRLLLVDDVFTTGATLSECAKSLKKAGADGVDVLTLARTE